MSGSSTPSQASFPCVHCKQSIFIPANLPPTVAPCPHCGREVTSPDLSVRPLQAGGVAQQPEQPIRLDVPSEKPSVQEDLTSPPPSENMEGDPSRKKSNLPIIIAAVVILLMAGALTFWLAKNWKNDRRGKKPTPASSAAGGAATNSEASWITEGWKKDASEVLKAFMSAKTHQERMKHVIPNEGVLEELKTFYPEGTDDSDTPMDLFVHKTSSMQDHKRGIFLMQYSQPAQIDIREYFAPIGTLEKVMGLEPSTLMDMAYRIDEHNLAKPIGINAYFKKTDDGLKLDASVFIQEKFRTFRKFVDYPNPGKSQVFRIVVSETLSHKYRNNKHYRTYRLEDFAYPQDFVIVPVRVDSEVGKILSAVNWRGMNRPLRQRTATVELQWSEGSPSRLSISKVLCWEFLGVGGKLGNTSPQAKPAPAKTPEK